MKTPIKQNAPVLKWSGWTDIGKVRKNNEDAFLGLCFDAHEVHHLGKFGDASMEKHDFTFAMCDGMGGAKAGEYASEIAVEKITTLLPRSFHQSASVMQASYADVLAELFTQIHRALVYLGDSYDECHGMQTTLSLGWFTPGWVYFGHVGDSRIYHLPKGEKKILQLTEDDTHVGWLFRNGQINEREARTHPRRNVLQKALGGENQFVDPQVGAVDCARGDIFLLCSDGLTGEVPDVQIEALLSAELPLDEICANLVDAANLAGGHDNITCLLVRAEG